MGFYRIDFKDSSEKVPIRDFLLIHTPVEKITKEVRAYHLELLNLVRSFDNFWLIESDKVLFAILEIYYQKIADRLIPSFDAKKLESESRHRFFVADKYYGDTNWLSGLEYLMGYRFDEPKSSKPGETQIIITSGDNHLDLVAELHLQLERTQIEWLINNYSQEDLQKIIKQISDRRQGKELIEKMQREKDREFVKNNPKLNKKKYPGEK